VGGALQKSQLTASFSSYRLILQVVMNLAPIALFVYNRPEHSLRILESLSQNTLASQSDLVIFSDAPRTSEHKDKVTAVRAVVCRVDRFKSVQVIERERNWGLAASIQDGVERICDEQGKVIVIEDDLVLSPYFLSFVNAALDRYQDESRVMQVSGYMFPGKYDPSSDALFLSLISCWGWGTWKRAWKHYDAHASGFVRLQHDASLKRQFNLGGAYDYFHMLEQQMRGEIDSWGIRWLLSVFLAKGLVLYPRQSLVKNAGVDGSGTHGIGVASLQSELGPPDSRYSQPHLPDEIELDVAAMEQVRRTLRAANSGIMTRLLRKLVG